MPQHRRPRWYAIPVRVLLVTFLCTLLAFALSLLLGIVGVIVLSAVRHVHPDMRIAYRLFAVPSAIIAGSIVLVLSLVMEIRHYRQSKTLAGIARVS